MSDGGRLTRRTALKLGLAGAATAAGLDASQAAAGEQQTPGPQPARKPNILFLLVDEQRFPTVYESSALAEFRAAHLTAQGGLAKRGVSFDRHFVNDFAMHLKPRCAPSAGRYRCGITEPLVMVLPMG